jgi:hypothetical protein
MDLRWRRDRSKASVLEHLSEAGCSLRPAGNWFKCGRDSDESRPHAGTFTEASTSNRPTIKQINVLVTSEAHGQPWVRDSSHRVCM